MEILDVVSPSDFKIRISRIRDSEGNEILPSDVFLKFLLSDKYGKEYVAVHDPSGSRSINTYYDGNNLFVLVEHYDLKGQLKWKIATQTADEMFSDGNWTWWDKFRDLPINIVKR